MNPFFFGTSQRPLFGVYSHGRSGGQGGAATLMCYPIGFEYMRAHRAFRQLNTLLNRAGTSVLRFDYSRTGDSSGALVDASVDEWLEDIAEAVEELRGNSNADSVSIVGLRWGATLAARACEELPDVEHLVMWDPVVSGSAYLEERLGTARRDQVVGLEGFPMSPDLCEGLGAIDLRRDVRNLRCGRATLVVSEDRSAYREVAQSLEASPAEALYEVVPSEGDWEVADPFGDALIPQQIIHAIVRILQAKTVT